MAAHSACHPGRPRPHGESHAGCPGSPACQTATSSGSSLAGSSGRPPYSADRRNAVPRSSPERRTAGSAAEVHAAFADIGGADGQQAASQADDLVDVTPRPGLMLDVPHVQRRHVMVEVVLLNRRERVIRLPRAARRLVQHVIHVGDIPAYLRFHAEQAKRPGQRVDPDERGRVP